MERPRWWKQADRQTDPRDFNPVGATNLAKDQVLE